MNEFFKLWHEASMTTLGFFWMALWAFILGYIVSSMIQVFVTKKRMQEAMGKDGAKSMALGTFFGFISSSCSFAALSTTKSLFQKGAGLAPSIAFLLASTNLVIELGIVIAIFLGWQFVVGEYVGGILLILICWLLIKLTKPKALIKEVREKLGNDDEDDNDSQNWKQLIKSKKGWVKVARKYQMEWGMVWKDVTVGFTVAGIIAAFVPKSFFEMLFIGSGQTDLNFIQILAQTLIGPLAAFFTFIGSMGNIPLAAILFSNGVSFAGVMAFIFSDLVVFPVLRIQAKYYGWKMAFYIMGMFLVALVTSSILMHYGLFALDMLPETTTKSNIQDQNHFKINYTFFLNIAFLSLSGILIWLDQANKSEEKSQHGHDSDSGDDGVTLEQILKYLAFASYGWLAIGLLLPA